MSTLEEVLKKKRQQQEAAEVDHDAIRQEWISSCNALISTILEWLKPLEDQALLQVEQETIPIYEDQLGPYQAPALKLVFLKSQALALRPVGRFVLGAKGRVDLISGGTPLAMLVLNGTDHWQFARRETRYEKPRRWEFNRKSFEELLVDFLEE